MAGAEHPRYVLLHLVAGETFSSVVPAQVFRHAESHVRETGAGAPSWVGVGLLEPVRRVITKRFRRRVRNLCRQVPDVRCYVLAYSSRFPSLSRRLVARRIAALSNGDAVVFHCRGEDATLWAARVRDRLRRRGIRTGIVADIRGAWPEEFLLAQGYDTLSTAPPLAQAAYGDLIGRLDSALRCADEVMTVSRPLADWMHSKTMERRSITVVPCAVPELTFSDDWRTAMRREFQIADDELLFCYLGSLAPYQNVEEGALSFFRHATAHDARARLLVVTTEVAPFWRLIDAAGIDRALCRVHSASHDDVTKYLCAADAGLLLRAPNLVNRVSLPVKLGEYLASGVPVIVSRIAGWVSERIESRHAGFAVPWFESAPAEREALAESITHRLRADVRGFRERALRLCREEFVWSAYRETVRATYVRAIARASDARDGGGPPA